jgi:hypothetical protein
MKRYAALIEPSEFNGKGFGFLAAMVRQHLAGEGPLLEQYVRELFDLLIRTLPKPEDGDERSEIQGTP